METRQAEAFETLVKVAEAAHLHAHGLPEQMDVRAYWSGVVFSVMGGQFVAPMGEVAEMLEVPAYTHLPSVQQWVRGVANVRGRLLPLVDMAAFLGGKLESPRRQRRVLVLDLDELYSGLIVDGVYGIQHFPVDGYSPEMPSNQHDVLAPYLQGGFTDDNGQVWPVFSPWAMARDERFFQAAATT